MADIDRFKDFNDTYGHLVGDQVLRFVAQEMQQCVKGRDVLARYGGEEFAVLLPSTPLQGASMLAESIRVIIESQVVSNHSGKDARLRDHIAGRGSVSCPARMRPAFIARADSCLYRSKDAGRNRVTGENQLTTH